jgi:hypothetical protein
MLAAVGLIATARPAVAGDRMYDPQTRHTNGMLRASSDPHRATSVFWDCSEARCNNCGGQQKGLLLGRQGPARGHSAATCALANCPICQQQVWQGELAAVEPQAIDGMEFDDTKMLGEIPCEGIDARRPAAPLPTAPLPPGGGFQFTLPGFGLPPS